MRFIVLSLVVLCCASLVFGQTPGSIGLYADPSASMCSIPGAEIIEIFIIHVQTDGASACQFKVELPTCLVGLSQSSFFPDTYGNYWENVYIDYTLCMLSPNILGYFTAQDMGCDNCTYVKVLGNTEEDPPGLLVEICGTVPYFTAASGGQFIYKPVLGQCECDVPTENTTWGQVKALFE